MNSDDNHDNSDDNDELADDLSLLVALAVVDALDEASLAELETALDDRPDLRAELDSLRATAAVLAEECATEPPPELRASVLEAIAAEAPGRHLRAVDPGPADADDDPASAVGDGTDDGVEDPTVVSLLARRRSWLVAAGSVAAAVVLGIASVAILRDGGPSVDERIVAVIEHDEVQTHQLAGDLGALVVYTVPGHDDAVMQGAGIAPPEGSDVYELWRIDHEGPRRLEIFRPTDDGQVTLLLSNLDVAEGVKYAVTVEPSGGVDAPTGPIVAET